MCQFGSRSYVIVREKTLFIRWLHGKSWNSKFWLFLYLTTVHLERTATRPNTSYKTFTWTLLFLATTFFHKSYSLCCGAKNISLGSGSTETQIPTEAWGVNLWQNPSEFWHRTDWWPCFYLKTTRCMAVRNSSRLRQPSFVSSESCQILRSS